jgi:PfaB family protein
MKAHRMAIVGMEAIFADGRGIDSFDRYLYDSEQQFVSVPPQRKQQLTLDSDVRAAWLLADYTVCSLSEKLLNAVARQMNLLSHDIDLILISSAQISEDDFSHLQEKLHSFVVVTSMQEALQLAATLTQDGQRMVALAGVHILTQDILAKSIGNEKIAQEGYISTLSYEADMQDYLPGEGGGIVLCKEANSALAFGEKIYAFIEAVASKKSSHQACLQAMEIASVSADNINYLEATASAEIKLQQQEMKALVKSYPYINDLSCALGSARSVTGECGEFSLIAGLIKTVLCLYHRYIPGVKNWQQPKDLLQWEKSSFYFPETSRPWFLESDQHKRYGAYHLMESELSTHLILSENEEDRDRQSGYLAELPLHFFPLAGDSLKSLQTQLGELKKIINSADCVKTAARKCYEHYLENVDQAYALVVLGEEKQELLKEIKMMDAGIASAFKNGTEWKTPKGSYFTARPVGKTDKTGKASKGITFVYPGVGAAYVGLGQDLFHMFPDAYMSTYRMARNMGSMLKDRIINPRSRTAISFADRKQLDLELRRSLATISECGVGFAYVYTKIFEHGFDIKAEMAMGYSMGEVSMYTAMGCWEDPGGLSARLAASPTFNHNLTGELQTLRKHWDLPPTVEGEETTLWETYALKGTIEEVTAACENEDRVYVTIVNTPDSVVIGGDPKACERVIESLGVRGMAMELPSAIHCAPAFKEYENMEKLYTLDIGEKIDAKLYSSSCYLPIPQRSKVIANSIAKCFCEQVDFPRLVNTVYE